MHTPRQSSTARAVTMAAVLAHGVADRHRDRCPEWAVRLRLSEQGGTEPEIDRPGSTGEPTAELLPLGWRLRPQFVQQADASLVRELITATGADATERAPWWAEDFPDGTPGPSRAAPESESDFEVAARPDHRPGRSAVPDMSAATAAEPTAPEETGDHGRADSGQHAAARHHDWPRQPVRQQARTAGVDERDGSADSDDAGGTVTDLDAVRGSRPAPPPEPAARHSAGEVVAVTDAYVMADGAAAAPDATNGPRHPTIRLLGPIELLGAAGRQPSRALLQCIEYCTWLLEHPGSTAQAMARALVVAEGTRRSNMSRLRTWLGVDDRGEAYLPDAYSGRIVLSPLVSSDWHRLQILTATGVNKAGTESLCRALELVRGAPLADAAPGQWHWAEEMRTDMVSVIRDIGVELAERALADSDIDLARWAAARSLTAAPQDELLIGARIRTEHLAQNPAEVERLALQLSANARALGLDLHPATVDLLQRVMEGGLRARA